IDPVEYDKIVDGGLPLETLLHPDPSLRQILLDLSGARIWACTNAGLAHATRVLKILGVDDLFEGITFCDYAEPGFVCKPEREFYVKAMREAGVLEKLGWTTVHVADTLPSPHGHYQITDIHDLPK
ncbi:hypothetical protein HDU67_003226, partial [Dinochytrium kinnereticum]